LLPGRHLPRLANDDLTAEGNEQVFEKL
jgi:hypothetical protein